MDKLVDVVPKLREAWADTNTNDIESISVSSDRRIYLVCEEGHTWDTQAKVIGKGSWCPYCSGRIVIPGESSFDVVCIDIVEEFYFPEDNPGIDISTVSPTSYRVKLTWRCGEGHKYVQTPGSVNKYGPKCTVCRSFGHRFPDLVHMWSDKNEKSVYEVAAHENKKRWWVCANGDLFDASPAKIAVGRGCPYCSGKRVNTRNSLAAVYPDIAAEWSPNNSMGPDEVTPGADILVEWVCSNDDRHVWNTQPYHRTGPQKRGCPYCTKQILINYEDSLEYKSPEVAVEWDHELNSLHPSQVFNSSNSSRFWICRRDPSHRWTATVRNRTGLNPTGCPECFRTSWSMQEEFIQMVRDSAGNSEVIPHAFGVLPGKYELDVYLPDRRLAFEFNGTFWHSDHPKFGNPYSHIKKREMCEELGIRLIVIWEDTWRDRREVVERLVANKLGTDHSKPLGARSTSVDANVSSVESASFLGRYHIQGSSGGSIRIGLRGSDGLLVAVAVFKSFVGGILSLERFATSRRVPGGLSKILKYVDRNIEYTSMRTFADREISDGALYISTGWVEDGVLDSDYSYLVKYRRMNKRSFRIEDFKNKDNLTYIEGATEKELALVNKLWRTYDSGKIKYVRPNPNAAQSESQTTVKERTNK